MRLFIATTFPPEILRPLNECLDKLKPKLPSASWIRPETQHLTFAFLGEQDEAIDDFVETLVDNGAHVTVRRSKGREIAAACGQLRGKTERKRGTASQAVHKSG